MIERGLLAVVAVAAGVWLAVGLHAARLESHAQQIATRPPATLSRADVTKAVSLFERSRAHNPDTRPIVFEAGLLARKGRPHRAIALLRSVVSREPQNASAWTLLAIAAGTTDPALASRAAARARKLNPPVAPAP